ncbi:carbohydrate sulfotransferase 11-like [Watersipora subatra]|uniref:carbohydrate sulfotransferase 11-like n=1 Tax=Watersipora subatra TaxID=2589382 RepID=UPI00355AEE60
MLEETDNLRPPPSYFIYQAEASMRKRAADVWNHCSNATEVSKYPAVENDYIVTLNSTNYAYYPIAKCGWTTWTYVMFDAAGKPEEPNEKGFHIGWMSPFMHAGMQKVRRKMSIIRQYKERLLFVRDPYDRLVSAYKNKVLYGPYYLTYHTPCRWSKKGMDPPTFPQFVRCILEAAKGTGEKTLSSRRVAQALDIHWKPQYWSSLPCATNYTLIGKFEHLEEDISQTISILHLNASIPHKNASKKAKNETLAYWYNQVPIEDKRALQELYRFDFDIFNFNDTIPA